MAESADPLLPDGRLSRSGLSRVGESTARQESIFGGMPRINFGSGESTVQGPADSFWIQITAVGTNGQYAAIEVARAYGQSLGTVDQPPGDSRQWSLTDNPAQEVNNHTGVPVGSIVRAWNSGAQGIIEFDFSTSATPIGPVCPELTTPCPVYPLQYSLEISGVSGLWDGGADGESSLPCCPAINGNYTIKFLSDPNDVSGRQCQWVGGSPLIGVCAFGTVVYLPNYTSGGMGVSLAMYVVGIGIPASSYMQLEVNCVGGDGQAIPATFAEVTALYTLPMSLWVCLGPNTLTLTDIAYFGTPSCLNNVNETSFPPTITITPI